MDEPKITTLIRTHERPAELRACLESIAACRDGAIQLILISDRAADPVEAAVAAVPWAVEPAWTRFEPQPAPWPPNDYFNQARGLAQGAYLTYLDDDDRVLDPDYYRAIRLAVRQGGGPYLVIWKANLGRLYSTGEDTILPDARHWGGRPVLNRFSGIGFAVRADVARAVDWPNRRGGDWAFADRVWREFVAPGPVARLRRRWARRAPEPPREPVIFVDRVLSGTQRSLSTHRSAGSRPGPG
mgnify:CR=1 FL=1